MGLHSKIILEQICYLLSAIDFLMTSWLLGFLFLNGLLQGCMQKHVRRRLYNVMVTLWSDYGLSIYFIVLRLFNATFCSCFKSVILSNELYIHSICICGYNFLYNVFLCFFENTSKTSLACPLRVSETKESYCNMCSGSELIVQCSLKI